MRRRPFGRYCPGPCESSVATRRDSEFPRNPRRKSTAARATSRRRPPEAHRAHAHRQIAHGRRKGATLPTGSNRRFELRSSPSISSPEDPSKARRFAMAQACQPGEDAPPSYNRLASSRSLDPLVLVDGLDAQLARFCEFRAGARAATTRLVFDEMEPETLAPSRSAMALASSRVIFSKEPVNTMVWPASGWPAATASIGSTVTSCKRASSAASLRGSAKKSAIAWRQPDRCPRWPTAPPERLGRARRRAKPPIPRNGARGAARWSRRRGECRAHRGSG